MTLHSLASDGRVAYLGVRSAPSTRLIVVEPDGTFTSGEIMRDSFDASVTWSRALGVGLVAVSASYSSYPPFVSTFDAQGRLLGDPLTLAYGPSHVVATTSAGFLLLRPNDGPTPYAVLTPPFDRYTSLRWIPMGFPLEGPRAPLVLSRDGVTRALVVRALDGGPGSSVQRIDAAGTPRDAEPVGASSSPSLGRRAFAAAHLDATGRSLAVTRDGLMDLVTGSVTRVSGEVTFGTDPQSIVNVGDEALLLGDRAQPAGRQTALACIALEPEVRVADGVIALGDARRRAGEARAIVRTDRGAVVAWTQTDGLYVQFIDCGGR